MGVAYSCVEPLAALFGVRATVPALRQHCTTAQAGQTGGVMAAGLCHASTGQTGGVMAAGLCHASIGVLLSAMPFWQSSMSGRPQVGHAARLVSTGSSDVVVYLACAVMPRKVETGQQLLKLEKVNNARDLAEACANIRPGLLFRSACPNAATAADIEILRDQLKIRQLVRVQPARNLRLLPLCKLCGLHRCFCHATAPAYDGAP
jgi:Tyrosine phosphatase family